MADRLWRVQCSLRPTGGNPVDSIVNVFHFDGDDTPAPPETYRDAILSGLQQFYDDISDVLSTLYEGHIDVKMYDLRQPAGNRALGTTRPPVATGTVITSATGAGVLPTEVAICMSYAAAPEEGESVRRRRGRLFIGPISADAVQTVGGQVFISPGARNVVNNAASVLAAGVHLPGAPPISDKSVKWAVFSPRTVELGGSLDDAFNDVTHGYTDNAFDTQRSRGPRSTARTTWTL